MHTHCLILWIKLLKMKNKIFPIALIIVFANVLFFVVFKGKKAPKIPLSKTELVDEQNKIVDWNANKHKATIISYYQSWCGECREELLELEALQQIVGGEQQLKIIMISDEPWNVIQSVSVKSKKSIQFVQSKNKLRDIGIRRFPTTYFLDVNLKVVDAKVEGIHWNTKEIQDKIYMLNKQ